MTPVTSSHQTSRAPAASSWIASLQRTLDSTCATLPAPWAMPVLWQKLWCRVSLRLSSKYQSIISSVMSPALPTVVIDTTFIITDSTVSMTVLIIPTNNILLVPALQSLQSLLALFLLLQLLYIFFSLLCQLQMF